MQKRFIDEKCVVCNEPFVEDDDIAVCPECGAPYHRDCYAMNGSCVYKEQHGEFVWESEKSKLLQHFENISLADIERERLAKKQSSEPVDGFIKNLTEEDSDDEKQDTSAEEKSADYEETDGVSESDMEIYLGESSGHFMPAYKEMIKSGKMLHLNFHAFLLSFFYIFYKRLYGFAWGLLMMMSLAFSLLTIINGYDFGELTSNPDTTKTTLTIIFGVLVLLIALYPLLFFDYYYLKTATRKIKMLKTLFSQNSAEDVENVIRREGRSSYTSCIFGAMIFVYMLVIARSFFTFFILSIIS